MFFAKFKQNRLAYGALIIWFVMSIIVLAAPLFANDKPLLLQYQHQWYVPLLYQYPETTFGGVFETATNYKDPVVKALIEQQGMMIMPIHQYTEHTPVLDNELPHPSAPTIKHWLGTDTLGYDVFSRVLYGLRVSLLFGLALTVLGGVIGLVVGAVMGYFGSWVDLLGQRAIEVWLGLPQLFVLLILSSVFEPSVVVLFAIMLLFAWLPWVSMTRVHFLRIRQSGFVLTAKNLGVPTYQIIWRHMLPSMMPLLLAQMPFVLASNIISLTALDFLGLGLPVGSPSLGELLLQGKNHLDAPHLILTGFVVLGVVLMLLIFIGEGCRQALDMDKSHV